MSGQDHYRGTPEQWDEEARRYYAWVREQLAKAEREGDTTKAETFRRIAAQEARIAALENV